MSKKDTPREKSSSPCEAIAHEETDKDDRWQTTHSFNLDDLPRVELVSRQAFASTSQASITLRVAHKPGHYIIPSPGVVNTLERCRQTRSSV